MVAALRQPLLHPLWRARALAWRNRPARTLAWVAPVAATAVALAFWSSRAGLTARAADAPLVPTILLFALTFMAVRAVVVTAERDMRSGWFAALPIGDGARLRTAVSFALVAAVVVRVPVDLAFALAGLGVPGAFNLASIIAVVVALATTRRVARTSSGNPALHQVPKLFFARATPTSRSFPHLPAWQRLRTTAHWRTTGRAWQLGLIALALPRNAALVVLPALVVLGSLLWWGVMLRAVASVARDAGALLAAVPHDRPARWRAALRYPLAATLVTASIVYASTFRP